MKYYKNKLSDSSERCIQNNDGILFGKNRNFHSIKYPSYSSFYSEYKVFHINGKHYGYKSYFPTNKAWRKFVKLLVFS